MLTRFKLAVFFACLFPFGQLLYYGFTDDLTANPIEFITRFTGSWALILLLASLSVTPLRKILGWNDLIKFRRMLGLFAFFYALLHFSTYMVLDHFFDFPAIVKDIIKRPYVTVGFTGFVLMIPLAITSTAAMIRRLGKRWQQLHRLVYVAAIAGVVHFYWLVKADIRRPVRRGLSAAARVPIDYNMGAAMAEVPKVPVVPFVQVVVVKKLSIAPVLPVFAQHFELLNL
jgi:methionine sulfoxide reductase heme-binding subunit